MKSSNTMLRTAVALALGAGTLTAQAGQLTTINTNAGTYFATQIFGSTVPVTKEVVPDPVTYTFVASYGGIFISPGGKVNLYFRLGNGAQFTSKPTIADFSGSVVTQPPTIVANTFTPDSTGLSADNTTVVLVLKNNTGNTITIGSGATVKWNPATGRAVDYVSTVLNTAGNSIGIIASVSDGNIYTPNPNATPLPSDLDGGIAPSVNIATAKSGITAKVTASSAFTNPEMAQIDISPPSAQPQTQLTPTVLTNGSNTVLNLGSVTFTDTGAKNAANTGTYGIGDMPSDIQANGFQATVTGNFAAATTNGVKPYTDSPLHRVLGNGTYTLNVAKTAATFANGKTLASGLPYYIGYTVNGTTVIPPTTPSITASLTPVAPTDTTVSVTGSLYALTPNGSTVDVRDFTPVAGAPWQSYLHIINNGNLATPISVQLINPETGAIGNAGQLDASLPVGAARTYSAAQVETAVNGGPLPNIRPRIRVTGVTSGVVVQNFLYNPDGTFSEASGGLAGGSANNQSPGVISRDGDVIVPPVGPVNQ